MAFTEQDGITEMKSLEVDRVDAVGTPANGAPFLVLKSAEKAKYSAEQLRGLYKQGKAMKGPHGNIDYPIADDEDLHNAIRAAGRGNAPHNKIRRYIEKRAKALGHADWIPDNWSSSGASKEASMAEPTVPADDIPAVHEAAAATDVIEPVEVRVSTDPPGPTAEADGAPQTSPEPSADAPLPADGNSSSLGDQHSDPASAEAQTVENCTPPGGSSDQQARQDAQTQKAKGKHKGKRKMRNPEVVKAVGDGKWESTDVALGEHTIEKLRQALVLAQEFTAREQREAAKEISMTHEELAELAGMLTGDKKAKKAKSKEGKASKKAAKKLAALEERLATVEGQPPRSRPILSGAAKSAPSGSVFKELEDRVEQAAQSGRTDRELSARKQLTQAKLFAIESARARGVLPSGSKWGPNMTPILTNTYMIADDPTIIGVPA